MAKKEITQLEKEFKKIRIDQEINRAQMAKALKLSDRELTLIESGKVEASDKLLITVAEKFSDSPEDASKILYRLRRAFAQSVPSITFNLSELTEEQKDRVLTLRKEIGEENEAENAKREEERRKLREERAAARQAAKSVLRKDKSEKEKVGSDEKTIVEKSVDPDTQSIDDIDDSSLSDEEMDILASLENLEEAA